MRHVGTTRYASLLTVQETAAVLHVSRQTLYRLIGRGELRPVRVGERLRFEADELRRYLDESRV